MISGGLVTLFAFHFGMNTSEDESSLGMIEGRILPACFLMAGFAFRTQLVLMRIVLAVARNTGCIQLLAVKRFFRHVAFLARSFLVFESQRVTGIPFMVENY